MSRCARTTNLEVHRNRRDGGSGLDNAKVLCHACHQELHSYGLPSGDPEDFEEGVREAAMERAGYRCQCTSLRGCH